MNMQNSMQKAMNTMFQKIGNVSYDLASGLTGIKTDNGIVTVDWLDSSTILEGTLQDTYYRGASGIGIKLSGTCRYLA